MRSLFLPLQSANMWWKLFKRLLWNNTHNFKNIIVQSFLTVPKQHVFSIISNRRCRLCKTSNAAASFWSYCSFPYASLSLKCTSTYWPRDFFHFSKWLTKMLKSLMSEVLKTVLTIIPCKLVGGFCSSCYRQFEPDVRFTWPYECSTAIYQLQYYLWFTSVVQ